MKRVKHHKIKKEKAESSTQQRVQEEHDLAYYIHDRVELMHQVFSILKYKELKIMAPECVRNLAVGDLQELCTEELLGISSKRLLAILDGVETPSDTESSSPSTPPEQLETISLDSISSDEELLASNSKKKKHKHRRRSSKSKSKKKDKPKDKEHIPQTDEISELSKASRAGLTVLELLELQARARAIRAQLQQEQVNKQPSETTAAESSHHSSENEVEIKEEPADVVEISSEDEKPNVDQLKNNIAEKPTLSKVTNTEPLKEPERTPQRVTKRVNDLIITVPQAVTTRKIRLNRNKVTMSTANSSGAAPTATRSTTIVATAAAEKTVNNSKNTPQKPVESKPKKRKKDKKKKAVEKDGSDHDEITLQLSDSEKMDLLEDLDESRKNYDRVSSSSEDTDSSSSDSEDDNISDKTSPFSKPDTLHNEIKEKEQIKPVETSLETLSSVNKVQNTPNDTSIETLPPVHNEDSCFKNIIETEKNNSNESQTNTNIQQNDSYVNASQNMNIDSIEESANIENRNSPEDKNDNDPEKHSTGDKTNDDSNKLSSGDKNNDDPENLISGYETKDHEVVGILLNETAESSTEQTTISYKTLHGNDSSNDTLSVTVVDKPFGEEVSSSNNDSSPPKTIVTDEKVMEITSIKDTPVVSDRATKRNSKKSRNYSEKIYETTMESEKDLSDGELSDRQSSEVEAVDVQPEVVCISDEESPKKKHDKKKKKKEKKSKKDKKSKKSKLDFCEGSDQNFFKDANLVSDCKSHDINKSPTNETTTVICDNVPIDLDSDEVYEYFELSDDSSCYEVEGTVLSKEPTAEEIKALSAKIDEIKREDVVTDAQIREHEQIIAEKDAHEPDETKIENVSWKDRYLGSKKVIKVLTTANILNALRNKNKELKKKIHQSKMTEEKQAPIEQNVPKENIQLEEGSMEQYNALQGSTKFVDPVKEPVEENNDSKDNKEQTETLVKVLDENDVTREMKKDARQLLKMYRRLLKHNDMNKQKDPGKKKKKKQKKKDKHCLENNVAATTVTKIDESI